MLIIKRFLVLAIVVHLGGCAVNRASGELMPGATIPANVEYYVVTEDEEKRETDQQIATALADRGISASVGAADETPENAGVIVKYDDKWMWDITMYMIELTIHFENPEDGFPIATGNSYHTSLTRKSPDEMIDEVLTNIFAAE